MEKENLEMEVLKDSISVSVEGLLLPRYTLEYLLRVKVNGKDYLVKEERKAYTYLGMRWYIEKKLSIYGDEVYKKALRLLNKEWKKWNDF